MLWPRWCLACSKVVKPGDRCLVTVCPWSLGVDDYGIVIISDHPARLRDLDGGPNE